MNILVLAWRNLFRNYRRTLASLITIAFGAMGLLIYQGFQEGIMNQYRENTIRVRYGHGQLFQKGYYGQVYEKPWEHWIENWQDIDTQLKALPQIKDVYPRVSFYSFLQKGGITLAGRGEGTLPERENLFFTAMNFEDGKDLSSDNEIILGKGLAESLNAKAGDTVTLLVQTLEGQLNGGDFVVAGVFHTGAKEFDDRFFRIHLNTAQSLLDTQKIEYLSVQTESVEVWKEFSQEAALKLPNLESIPFEELDKVYYKNSVDFLQAQFQFIRTIILLIVALGIFNTITIGLLERSGEVGALRANGETRSRLFKIFLLENAFLGILGGVLGAVLALFVNTFLLSGGIAMPPGPGITRQFLVFLEILPVHVIQASILPAVVTVIASAWPIRKLLKKPISSLLRS